jgi:hypothetical protein
MKQAQKDDNKSNQSDSTWISVLWRAWKTTKQPITFCMDPQSYGRLGKQQSNHHILQGFSSYGSFKYNNKAVTMFYRDSCLIEASKDNNKAVTDSTGILSTGGCGQTNCILQGSSSYGTFEDVNRATAL